MFPVVVLSVVKPDAQVYVSEITCFHKKMHVKMIIVIAIKVIQALKTDRKKAPL